MSVLLFKALIHRERFYIAECPDLGLEAQGRNPDEALAGLRLATQEYLVTLGDDLATVLATLDTLGKASGMAGQRRAGVLSRRYSVEIDDDLLRR